jgi:hypothetical protein
MSALPLKADIRGRGWNVRLTGISGPSIATLHNFNIEMLITAASIACNGQ